VKINMPLEKVLGLEPDAKITEVKRAYRELALKYHPDVAPEDKKVECIRILL